jgi:hypothetical protein
MTSTTAQKYIRCLPPRPPDEFEASFRDELARGCPGCGSTPVTGRFRGRWEFTLRCTPSCPSWTGTLSGFTGHTIGAAAAQRAGMTYRAIDGSTGAWSSRLTAGYRVPLLPIACVF